jgi:two-component system, cell cycle response regulator
MSPGSFELVIMELLENSLKFHPRHEPRIDIVIGRLGPGEVMVEVTDDGSRIATEQLASAWQPYFQAENGFTGQTQGMGLGLATVAVIVWSAGGACHLRNRAGEVGVVVRLELPARPVEPSGEERPPWM